MLTNNTIYWPYKLIFTVKGANNVKISGVRSCDPYIIITIDGKIFGQTATSYSLLTTNSDPIWNENFSTPLLHSEILLKFSLYDRRMIGADFLVGEAELYVDDHRKNMTIPLSLKAKKDNLTTGVIINIDLNITTCDSSIKVTKVKKIENNKLIRSNSIYNLKSPSSVGSRRSSGSASILFSKGMLTSSSSNLDNSQFQGENYLSHFDMPSVVRSVLLSSPILPTLNSTPNLVNDFLSDLENLSLLPNAALSNTKKNSKSPLVRDPIPFCVCTDIDLVTGACSYVMPIYSKDSFPLRIETPDTVLLLRMPNQYVLWIWLSALKRAHTIWHNASSTLPQLPSPSPPNPSTTTDSSGGSSTGFNSQTCRAEIYSHGAIQRIFCVISATRPELRCYYSDSEKVSVIDLTTILSVTVSCDFTLRGHMDLNVEILTTTLPFEYWNKDIRLFLKPPNQEAVSTTTQNGINTLIWNKKMSFSLPENTSYDSKETEIKYILTAMIGKDTLLNANIPLSSLKTDDDLEGLVMEETVKLRVPPKLLIKVVSANNILCLPCVLPEDGIEVNCAVAGWNGVVKDKIKTIVRGNRNSVGAAQRKGGNSVTMTYIKPRLSDMKYETVSVRWNYDYTLNLSPDTAPTAEYVRVDMIDKMSRTSLGRAFIPLGDFSETERELTYDVVPYDDVSSSFAAQLGTITVKLKYAPILEDEAIEVKLKSSLKKSDDYTTFWPIESIPTKALSRIDIRSVVERYCIRIGYDGLILVHTSHPQNSSTNNDSNDSLNSNVKFKPIVPDTGRVKGSPTNTVFTDLGSLNANDAAELEELESLLLPAQPVKKRGHVRHSSAGGTRKSSSADLSKLGANTNTIEGKSVIRSLSSKLYNPFSRKTPPLSLPPPLNAPLVSGSNSLDNISSSPKSSVNSLHSTPTATTPTTVAAVSKEQKPAAPATAMPRLSTAPPFRSRRRTRQQAFAENEDLVLALCRERGDNLDADLRVPWAQVSSVVAITPAILVITIRIHRYSGIGAGEGEATETFEAATVELFVQGCPAMSLRKILMERQEVAGYREAIQKLASKSLDPVLRNGKSFQRSLRSHIVTLYHTCHSLVKRANLLVGYKTGISPAMLWLDTPAIEKKKLLTAITRLRLYMAMLLEKFEVMKFLKEDDLFRKDQTLPQPQAQMQPQTQALGTPAIQPQKSQAAEKLLITKDKLDALIQGAENHLVCAAVYAEVHDKSTSESEVNLMVNRYFSHIISVLGKIHDDLKGLTKVENLESHFIIVYLFVGGNERLHRVLSSTFVSLSMAAAPPPTLSLVFDIETILATFSKILLETLIALVALVVQNWRTESKTRNSESKYKCPLPWDPVEKSAADNIPVLVSRIPEDIAAAIRVCLVLDGLENTFFADSLRGTTCPEAVVQTLQDTVTASYLHLHSQYIIALEDCCAEWPNSKDIPKAKRLSNSGTVATTATVPTTTTATATITPAERIEDNLFFLCSVANDAYRIETGVGLDILIDSRCEEFGLTAEEFRSLAVCASFNSLRCSALEYLISLLFQPLQKKYIINFTAIWLDCCHKDANGPMDKIMKSLCNNVLFLREKLELSCFRELIEVTVSRIVRLFFTFLNDALVTDVVFSEIELRRIIVDIDMIKEYLSAVAATENRYHPASKSTQKIEDDINLILQPLNMVVHLLIAPLNSTEFVNAKLAFSHYDNKHGALGDLVSVKLVELRADQGIYIKEE